MRISTFLTATLAMSALCWTGTTACAAQSTPQEAVASNKAEIGKPAPAFTLMDLEGKPVSLSDFKGKTVVIEWFCPTCPFSGSASGRSWSACARTPGEMRSSRRRVRIQPTRPAPVHTRTSL